MNSAEFKAYKAQMRLAIRSVLASAPPRSLDEAGFPAYAHPNPFINWLFWQRLWRTMRFIRRHGPYDRALDFGCGSGVMLPFLAQASTNVVALDIELGPLERMRAHIRFPDNIEVHQGDATLLKGFPDGSFDLITALDVLEHVGDLGNVLESLLRLLRPGGFLVVSGPTENLLYRLGRRVAGPEYSGAYHERGIGEVRRELASRARVHPIATLYWPLPFFEVFFAIP